jgi:predicted RNA-binding Zn ribbon-like protein
MNNDAVEVPPLRVGSRKPAPGDLQLVQGFINTLDLEDLRDDVADAAALGHWFANHGLTTSDDPISDSDHHQALAVREALRRLLMANSGAPMDAGAVHTLNGAAKGAELVARFDSDGGSRLVPVRGGVDEALGRLFTIVARAQVDGTWERMKACPREDCGWAFYDWSKNRSATWCSMEVCGNRAKAAAYRDRRRGEHSH